MNNIDIVILCGGKGERLKKIAGGIPKPMMRIRNKPFLDFLINYYVTFGLKRFILCTGYNAGYIKRYYKRQKLGKGVSILFSKEKGSLDTAGAVKNAEKFIKSDNFLVVNGDSFCPLNLRKLIRFHRRKSALITMVVAMVKDPKDFGSVVLDKSNKIAEYKEKKCSAGSFVNAGIYLFRKEALSMLPRNARYSLEKEFFPRLAGKNMFGYINEKQFMDIGTPERYELAKIALGA